MAAKCVWVTSLANFSFCFICFVLLIHYYILIIGEAEKRTGSYALSEKKRLSHDPLYNVHELAHDLPEFVHSIHTYLPWSTLCLWSKSFSKWVRQSTPWIFITTVIILCTTFQLGDFYISVLSFHHTLFTETPTIPAALYERKFEEHHRKCSIYVANWWNHLELLHTRSLQMKNELLSTQSLRYLLKQSCYVAGTTSLEILQGG